MAFEGDLNLEATELRLGLPGTPPAGTTKSNKRGLPELSSCDGGESNASKDGSRNLDRQEGTRPAKEQVVGWPPIRSYRRNCFQPKRTEPEPGGAYIKVSMDGAPYLRKIDLTLYKGYPELLKDLEHMFKFKAGEYSERECYSGSEFVPTYEDRDSDWMLVGDVPWDMFITSCKRLRIMKVQSCEGFRAVKASMGFIVFPRREAENVSRFFQN